MVSDLYRQRAIECERMALKYPEESQQLMECAKHWRWLADAAKDLSETVTIH
jgi:hypothetical protein